MAFHKGSAWLTGGQGTEFILTAGKCRVIQAITIRYFNGQPIRATPEIVYHAARAAFARADAGLINSVATYLWAIRDGYGTALAVEALLQARDLHYAHPHGWQGCQFAQPGFSRSTTRGRSCTPQVATNLTAPD